MKNKIEEISKATAIVAGMQNPYTNAQCAVDAHANGGDVPEMQSEYFAMRDQYLVELQHQNSGVLPRFLIERSIAKTLALEVMQEADRIEQEVR